jgi:sugar/nucleoside kinase (ribokinase family)
VKRDLIVCCGSLTLDNVRTGEGQLLPQSCGGNVVYSALAARLWHDRVGMVSRRGSNYPEGFLAALEARGLDLGGIVRQPEPHGMNVAFCYGADGSRVRAFPPEVLAAIPPAERERFIDYTTLGIEHRYSVWRDFAPDGSEIPEPWLTALAGVHCAAMPIERHRSIANRVRSTAGDAVWLQVDSPWYDERDLTLDHACPLFTTIDALLPSEDDARRAAAGSIENGVADALAAGARLLVLKRGGAGCTIFSRNGSRPVSIPPLPCDVVDLTGAGDAFCGGFLAGMFLTGDVVSAAAYGTVSASFAIEGPGVSRLLSASAVEASHRLSRLLQAISSPTA